MHGVCEKGESPRVLILCAGDPDHERTFSGSARSLFQALERRGCVHAKANVAGYTDPFQPGGGAVGRVLRRLDRFGLEKRYRWSPVAFRRNTARARRAAAAHPGFNACLMYGTNYHPGLPVPTYCYFDATAVQVYDARIWAFRLFSEAAFGRIRAYQKGVFDHCAGIFPRTRWAAASVEQDYGVPDEKICVAGAGPNHYAEPLPHGPYDRRRILFIGRQFELKGGPLLLEAFRLVRRTLPRAGLVIVGCSPAIDEPGVEVVGPIRKDEPGGLERLLRHYSEASVLCIMSRFEAFGIVIVEAQNCYVPCVAPGRFAFPETIRDGETGRLVPEYDARMLAEVLVELLGDPARLEAMGRAGHDFVRAHYTWDEAARRIWERIARDLRRGAAGSGPVGLSQ